MQRLASLCVLLAAWAAAARSQQHADSTGGGPTGKWRTADALLVIGSPAEANGVLADAVALGKVKTYLLTSLSMDPAAFEGFTFAGDDLVWGVQLLPPPEADGCGLQRCV